MKVELTVVEATEIISLFNSEMEEIKSSMEWMEAKEVQDTLVKVGVYKSIVDKINEARPKR